MLWEHTSGENWVGRKENDETDGLPQRSRGDLITASKRASRWELVSRSDYPRRRRQRSLMHLGSESHRSSYLPVGEGAPSRLGAITGRPDLENNSKRDDTSSTAHQRRKPFKWRSTWPLLLQPPFSAGTRQSANRRSAGRLLSRQHEHHHHHRQTGT